ncbi:hypothetical protein TNCV_2969691 [Trichonephila clavipes]|nr:hypothetical protein TNCV_2969691 [Trichonephila clavipes]
MTKIAGKIPTLILSRPVYTSWYYTGLIFVNDAGCHWEMEREAFLHPISRLLLSPCGWACLRESVLIGGSNVASRRGFEIEDFLQYGFGRNVFVPALEQQKWGEKQVSFQIFPSCIATEDHLLKMVAFTDCARWSTEEIRALINIWGNQEMQPKFDGTAQNSEVYKKIFVTNSKKLDIL